MSEHAPAPRVAMRRLSALVSSLLLVAMSCLGSDSTGPSTQNGLSNGTFSASINGSSWSAVGRVAVVRTVVNSLGMAGVSPAYGITLSLQNATAPGSFVVNSDLTIGSVAIVGNTAGAVWATNVAGGTGTVTITTLTSTRVAGTFSFDAVALPGAGSGTLHVTGGTFDVTY